MCIDYIISYRTNYIVIAVIKRPEPVVDGEWIPAGMGRQNIKDTVSSAAYVAMWCSGG